ncbi:carbohydrate-binding module family 19 protein [Conidiobolus coronatus NRRL 28638]|uniref:Carbohydrate-binding module family 19 protein n=1 Tax=Conidiobolus coronatus (strain ATCC 28846 / CBS 209.66 / NRRL 28638) TaxID=796925 RepID=A0A137PG87_CONC2|nr:carbohydrate-binding module family 19 protein [Conidiobolus coronatus NRRL 28638]|eukprot:KXN74017.1 carbohydrate-binding module family 19 protein [Conidiobolus coronatus NRRL 28638]
MRQFISFILSLISFLTVVSGANNVVIGYWTDWTTGQYPTSAVPWDLLTHVNYAFGLFTDQDWKIKIDSPQSLKELVAKSKPTGTKILISIGGWTGSKYFSPMVASAANRATFIKNTLDFVKEYGIDGVDFDWEYPGREGAPGNIISPQDSANYLIFLKELKAALPSNILITCAVRVQPFDGPNGPLKDVSAFAQYFDLINLMAYDLNGPWSSVTGPVGGLDYEPGKATPFSVRQAVTDWGNAGIPKNKLVVGVPFYGYALGVSTDMSQSDSQYAQVTNNNLPSYAYNQLFSNNILSSPLEANTNNGWIRKFDKITKTPWLFNKNSKTFIAYEDPLSLTHKTEFVRCNGYRGAMLWALNNDYNSILLKALQNVHNTGACNGIPDPTTTIPTPNPTTTTTTTKPTSNPPTSTTTTTTSPVPTGSCKDNTYKCDSTKNSTYFVCNHGTWLKQNCSSGTLCNQNGDQIYCGFTRLGLFIHDQN